MKLIIFKAPQTWIAVNVDGNQVAEPLSQTYSAEDTIKYIGKSRMAKRSNFIWELCQVMSFTNGEGELMKPSKTAIVC